MKATMWIEHQWTPSLQQVHDRAIMTAFIGIEGITLTRLIRANLCRLYPRIITIADLCNTRGTFIPGSRLDGRWRARSSLEWPVLNRPPAEFWRDFRWCIRRAFCMNTRPGRLTQPIPLDMTLGPWLPATRHIVHDFYRTSTTAHQRTATGFAHYNEPTHDDLPHDAHPIDACYDHDALWTSEGYSLRHEPVDTPRSLIRHSVPDSRRKMAGSDGSVHPVSGTTACAYIAIIAGV